MYKSTGKQKLAKENYDCTLCHIYIYIYIAEKRHTFVIILIANLVHLSFTIF